MCGTQQQCASDAQNAVPGKHHIPQWDPVYQWCGCHWEHCPQSNLNFQTGAQKRQCANRHAKCPVTRPTPCRTGAIQKIQQHIQSKQCERIHCDPKERPVVKGHIQAVSNISARHIKMQPQPENTCQDTSSQHSVLPLLLRYSGSSSVNRPNLPARNSSSKIFAIRSVSTSPPEIRKPRFRPAASSSR